VTLLERDTELRWFDLTIGDAVRGTGSLTVLEGSAGVGKSSLVAVARERAAGGGMRVLQARGNELERDFAFGSIRRLFEPVLSAATERERARLLAGAAAAAAWVIAPEPAAEDHLDRAGASFAVLHGIHWLALNLAAQTPLMLAVDDLHWVDPASLRALSYLAARVIDFGIAVVVALRPSEPGAPLALLDGLTDQPGARRITLSALSSESTCVLVRERIPDAPAELCAACHAASAGNPLYLHELLRALPSGGPISAEQARDAAVPSLSDRLARRVARVAPDGMALLRAMAVLDDGRRLRTAAKLAGLDDDLAAGIARRLKRIDVLAAEDPFQFVHPLLRRSVYDGLSVTERDAAHLTAAEILRADGAPVAAVAAHLAATRPTGSVTIAATLAQAARHALAMAAPDTAIALFARALDEHAPEPGRAVLLAELGFAEAADRDLAAVAHLREALELAQDPALYARVAAALAEILSNAGQWQLMTEVVRDALRRLGDGPPDILLEVRALWAIACLYDSRLADEFAAEREWLATLTTGGSWAARALDATLAAAAAIHDGRAERVLPLADRALRGGRLLRERGAGAYASMQVLLALVAVDEYDRALDVAAELVRNAAEVGSLVGAASALGARGYVMTRRGQLRDAEAELRAGLEMVAQARMPMMLTTAYDFFQDAILERPTLDDVAASMESMELEPAFLGSWGGAMLIGARGRIRLARGERGPALADLRAFAATCAALHVGPAMSSWRSTLALVLPADARGEAEALIDDELAMARQTGLPRPYGIALRAAGLLRGGEVGIQLVRDSATVLDDTYARLEQARTLVELGALLRRENQRTEARRQLSAGLELAHRCGAERLVKRARDELRAAGARPRREAVSGLEALTASELRVVRLAAAGRTNSEVAQDLWLSVKTVETHLSHAYGKLDLAGHGARGRLTEILQQTDPDERAALPRA
jgi:DNA-binding CsgD family transcriptional regulator